MFIKKNEDDIFNPENNKIVRHNLIKDEKATLKILETMIKTL